MSQPADQPHHPKDSYSARQTHARINRAEATAMGLLGLGALLAVIGTVLAFLRGGLEILLLGGILFLAGGIENVRAEVLKLRAKLDQD